jgi:hypothetical protein
MQGNVHTSIVIYCAYKNNKIIAARVVVGSWLLSVVNSWRYIASIVTHCWSVVINTQQLEWCLSSLVIAVERLDKIFRFWH